MVPDQEQNSEAGLDSQQEYGKLQIVQQRGLFSFEHGPSEIIINVILSLKIDLFIDRIFDEKRDAGLFH
jgi:hypothetical protein